MIKRKLVIFPFSGNGIEALDCIDDEQYDVVGFIDDDYSKRSDTFPVYSRNFLFNTKEIYVLAVPGSPASYRKRAEIISSLEIPQERFVTVIHPKASIGRNVKIGYNSLIMAGVVLTSNAVVGNHVCVLPNTVVHHDSIIQDYTLIGSNVVIAGGTVIGSNCYLGSGTTVINGVQVGAYSLAGLGSNIIYSVTEYAKMVGNPARNLNKDKR
jgi:sugar O-acyltransferase (sialic acid O-acetyltransferase NeuD family)